MALVRDLLLSRLNNDDSDDDSDIDPWDHLVSRVKDAYEWKYDKLVESFQSDGDSEETASAKAHNQLIPVYQKTFKICLFGSFTMDGTNV